MKQLNPQQSRAQQNPSAEGQTSLHFGRVSKIDTEKYHVRVQVAELGMESFWVPSMNPLPEVGELVAILMQGEGSGGLVLPLAKSKANRHKITYSDGTVNRYEDGTYEQRGGDQATVEAGRIDFNP